MRLRSSIDGVAFLLCICHRAVVHGVNGDTSRTPSGACATTMGPGCQTRDISAMESGLVVCRRSQVPKSMVAVLAIC